VVVVIVVVGMKVLAVAAIQSSRIHVIVREV
jgi:hypothetical protein